MPETAETPIAKSTLSDLLTIEHSASIFFSYARETQLSQLFQDKDAGTTLLVPTNKAVMALARKPHQGPAPLEDKIEISEQEFDTRSKENVQRWVSLHIIPQSPIPLISHTYPTLVDGKNVTFAEIDGEASSPEWSRVLVNGESRIIQEKQAVNGVFYLIDGTIKDE
ncbi:uncharacterized protein STEHIDRAFT_117441 [Stereum hirsutum FP-91666 SS1]|uniref:uncharacterized protein n=1 Tax=Stereum hirsutum (strain FP-91666) TaxID=721885 RepID=UPI000440E79E|nr:uncharacterized protein STEHIDRAFT_117441 [Stereum hirsutum FP-91666 SS1]EIM92422.1 hypothetical protein STEHIDRAFT_117441 [Stereum hirsutum FP-91666 SS1]